MDLGGVRLRQWKTLKGCLKITFNFKNTPQMFKFSCCCSIASETATPPPHRAGFRHICCDLPAPLPLTGIDVASQWRSQINHFFFFFCNSRNVLCGGFSFQIKTNALQRHAPRPGWALRLVVVAGDDSGIIGRARPFPIKTIQTGFGKRLCFFCFPQVIAPKLGEE